MTAIHGANMLNQFVVLNLSGGGGTALPFAPGQRESLVALFPDAYGACSACCCSWRAAVLDSVALLVLPGYAETPAVVALLIAVAEIAFPLWLLIKGVAVERWQQRA